MGDRRISLRSRNSDEGWVLFSVMVVVVIVFIVVTALLGTVVQHTQETARYQARTTAMHVADAGVNAYLQHLKRTGGTFVPTLGPTDMDQGTWTVTATDANPNARPPKPLTVRSVGVVPSLNATRTIVAEVSQPSFADYMFLVGAKITIGSSTVVNGHVRVNGNLTNDGKIEGRSEASGKIDGKGTFPGGKYPGIAEADFAAVTSDLEAIRLQAASDGTAFAKANTGTYSTSSVAGGGYRVVLDGEQVKVYKVLQNGVKTTKTESNSKWATTLDPAPQLVKVVNVPPSGVLHFDDRIWISGTYSAAITIAAREIYIIDHIKPQSESSAHVLGLISAGSISVPTWYTAMPTNLEIQAALLAQSGAISGDDPVAPDSSNYSHRGVKGTLKIKGSIVSRLSTSFYSTAGYGFVGANGRQYTYDKRLEAIPPPMYPQIRDGSFKVTSWLEGS